MRLFVAAELPQDMLDALAETSALLRDAVPGRFVAPDSFHVTLAFLGEVEGARVADAAAAVEEACAYQPAIRAVLGPFGSFGRRRGRMLWQGFAQGVDELASLAGDVRESLAARGMPFDPTAFVPHVTLIRQADLGSGMLPTPVVERGTIRTITLFRSDLSGERPRYEALERFELLEPVDEA
jgi:2'-5' RNA ligase